MLFIISLLLLLCNMSIVLIVKQGKVRFLHKLVYIFIQRLFLFRETKINKVYLERLHIF